MAVLNAGDLKKALGAIQEVCSKSEDGTVLSCAHFTKDYIESSNMLTAIRFPLSTGLDCLVPLRELSGLLSTVSVKDEVELSVNKGVMKFKSGGKAATINLLDSPYPKLDFPDTNWKDFPSDIFSAMEKCQFTNEIGVFVTKKYAITSDFYRVTRHKINAGLGDDLILDVELVKVLLSNGSPDEYFIDADDICFKYNSGMLVRGKVVPKDTAEGIKLYDSFKGTDALFKATHANKNSITLTKCLGEIEKSAGTHELTQRLVQEDDKTIEVKIDEKFVELTSHGSIIGELHDKIEGEASKKAFFKITPKYFRDIVANFGGESLELKYDSKDNSVYASKDKTEHIAKCIEG